MKRKIWVPIERFGFRVFVFLANAAYTLLKRLPVQNKVTFITWNSNSVPPDFRVLMDRLRQLPNPPQVVALCRELGAGVVSRVVFAFHMLRQMYSMATSKVVVLDTLCVLASVLNHRPELRVVQIWHALGIFKKFGWSIVDKSEGWSAQSNIPSRALSKILHMHRGYTDVVVSYSGAIPYFAEALRCDPEIIHVARLPRVDQLRDEKYMADLRSRILAAYPQLREKRVALYAPTIRRTAIDSSRVLSLVSSVDADGWNLVIKAHPVRGESLDQIFPEMSVSVPDFTGMELLAVADAVITDYSAITYEAYLRGIPVYFYAHDMAEYEQARGFYTHPSQFPSTIYTTAGDLIRDMDAGVHDVEAMKAFVEILIEDSDKVVDILDLINPGQS